MAAATNAQVQSFVSLRMRPFATVLRNLYLAAKDNRAAMDDTYENLNGSPDWVDGSDANPGLPAHMLSAGDVLAWNTFMANFIVFCEGDPQWPIMQKACPDGILKS